jgi:hypothetical protein
LLHIRRVEHRHPFATVAQPNATATLSFRFAVGWAKGPHLGAANRWQLKQAGFR